MFKSWVGPVVVGVIVLIVIGTYLFNQATDCTSFIKC